MLWHTHAVMGASTVWLLTPITTYTEINIGVLVAFAVVGALMPDLDANESKIKNVKLWGGKPFVPLSILLNRQFGHRGVLHSLRGWVIWTTLVMPLSVWLGWAPVAALSLGYASHLLGDACTRSGIPLLHPNRNRFHLLPKRLRLVTGSQFEEVCFASFAVVTFGLLFVQLAPVSQ